MLWRKSTNLLERIENLKIRLHLFEKIVKRLKEEIKQLEEQKNGLTKDS